MKKKELKQRIKDLERLTDCLISDNVRLLMRLGEIKYNYDDVEIPKFGTAKGTILERTKEPESKEQNDKRREQCQKKTSDYVDNVIDAMGRIHDEYKKSTTLQETPESTICEMSDEFKKRLSTKTEGAESESELKENECPYKIGDKWEAKNGEIMTMAEYDPDLSPDVQCLFTVGKEGRVGYSVKGIACCGLSDWDLVSKVK